MRIGLPRLAPGKFYYANKSQVRTISFSTYLPFKILSFNKPASKFAHSFFLTLTQRIILPTKQCFSNITMAFKKTIIKKEINGTTVNGIRTIGVTGTGRVALYLRFVLRHLFLIPQKGE